MFTTLRAAVGGRGSTMPDSVLERDVVVDAGGLARYARVCGFTLRDELPPTYPHVLAFELQMRQLARAPFSAIGVVHIANRLTQYRPVRLGETLSLSVAISAFFPHRSGQAFNFLTTAHVGSELVWDSASTNLKRGERDESVRDDWTFEDPPVTAEWRLRDDLGRRYAAVSGDHNPIHLHAWTAKPFGFERAIVHGMWTKARCLAALRLPDAFTAEVRFRRPILLPSTVTFGEAEGRFAVHGHVEGVYEVLTHEPGMA
jgi:acyl dehydratase